MIPSWPPEGYHTVATAATSLGVTKTRLYQILETAGLVLVQVGRAQLLTEAQVAQLRVRPRTKPGRKPQFPVATRRAREQGAFIEAVERDVVFDRDKGICGICRGAVGRAERWHVDHIVPLAKGGVHSYDNVQLAHGRCNNAKHAKLPKTWTLFQRMG